MLINCLVGAHIEYDSLVKNTKGICNLLGSFILTFYEPCNVLKVVSTQFCALEILVVFHFPPVIKKQTIPSFTEHFSLKSFMATYNTIKTRYNKYLSDNIGTR